MGQAAGGHGEEEEGLLETYIGTFSTRLSVSTRVSLSHRERRVSDILEL